MYLIPIHHIGCVNVNWCKCLRKFPSSSHKQLQKDPNLGERVVQPGEARDKEAKGSRRNPPDNDPQVTTCTMTLR